MEAIQQLEAIRNIVEAGDAQPGTSVDQVSNICIEPFLTNSV